MPKSLKKRERDSNMELLRILAMVLVMIVHANFRALPVPTQMETINFTLSSLLRFNTESISIVCVDVFVLLSGWYGIRFRWERLGELLFQIVFFVAIITIATANFTQKHIHLYTLLLLDKWDYWFVKAYVCLYFFSPVLNSFIQNTSKKEFKNFLLIYFLFQTVYGWISQGAAWFNRGYSSISFMGLYMLAQYVHIYHSNTIKKMKAKYFIFLFFLLSFFQTTCAFLFVRYNYEHLYKILYLYTSPIIIIQSICLLLFFFKLSFKSPAVNWIAVSCFAIYLLHSNTLIAKDYFDSIILNLYNNKVTSSFILYSGVYITAVFWTAIFIDKIRIALWGCFSSIKLKDTII